MILFILNKNIYGLKKRNIEYFFCALFFFIIIFPYSLYIIKLFLMSFLSLIILLDIKKNNLKMNREVFGEIIIFLLFNVFYLCFGEIRNGSAVKYYFLTHVMWILFYGLLFFKIDYDNFFLIFKTILFSTIIIYIIGIISAIIINYQKLNQFAMFEASIRPGYPFIAIHGGAIVNTIFISPILLLKNINRKNKLCIFLIILFIFVTSRRALMLNLMLVPFIYLFLLSFIKKKSERKRYNKILFKILLSLFILIIILFTLNTILPNFNLIQYINFFINAFKLTKSLEATIDDSSYYRALQFKSLIEGWKKHPLLGSGTAANATVIRSNIPGAYELTFVALLFQRGLLGFTIYILQLGYIVFYLFYFGLKYSQIRFFLFSMLTGFICFLIAHATNPYLEAFDHLWILFLPLYAINLLKHNANLFIQKYEYYNDK